MPCVTFLPLWMFSLALSAQDIGSWIRTLEPERPLERDRLLLLSRPLERERDLLPGRPLERERERPLDADLLRRGEENVLSPAIASPPADVSEPRGPDASCVCCARLRRRSLWRTMYGT